MRMHTCFTTLFLLALTISMAWARWPEYEFSATFPETGPPQVVFEWNQFTTTADPGSDARIRIYRRNYQPNRTYTSSVDAAYGAPIYEYAVGVGQPLQELSWTDTHVERRTIYEYKVECRTDVPSEDGYEGKIQTFFFYVGSQMPLNDNRGEVLLVVEEEAAATLGQELRRLEQDLTGDGWSVHRITHERSLPLEQKGATKIASQEALRQAIRNRYSTSNRLASILLFGHVPVIRSGTARKAHSTYRPAETDLIYADMDGEWEDSHTFTYADNDPNDGYLDESSIPDGNNNRQEIEVTIGRIDLANMEEWEDENGLDEMERLRNYLRKHHIWKNYLSPIPLTVVNDSIENGPQMKGSIPSPFRTSQVENIVDKPAQRVEGDTESLPGPYAFGFTTRNKTATEYGKERHPVVLAGVNVHDGEFCYVEESRSKPFLAQREWSLATFDDENDNIAWRYGVLGLGETMGTMHMHTVHSMAPNQKMVDTNLMGDPSLRLHLFTPPTNVAVRRQDGKNVLTWSASQASGVSGYHVYRANNIRGPYARLTSNPIGATNYRTNAQNNVYYMVRAIRLEQVPMGSFYNASPGAFAYMNANGSPNRPPSAPARNRQVEPGGTLVIDLRTIASDPDGDALLIDLVDLPTRAARITEEDGQVTYRARSNFSGSDSFTYTVWDGVSIAQGKITISAGQGTDPSSPPNVAFTSPAENAQVNASFQAQVNASDESGIHRVVFYVDNKYLGADTQAPYSWQFSGLAAGAHTIRAMAVDNDNVKSNAYRQITVKGDDGGGTPSGPLSVAFTSPADGAQVGASFTARVDAEGGSGVHRVVFYLNNQWQGADKQEPYTWSFSNLSDGEYTIRAQAIDTANKKVDAYRTVQIGNPGSSDPTNHWSFTTNDNDELGNINGIVQNGAQLVDGALVLDGDNDWLKVDHAKLEDEFTRYSVSLWFRTTKTTGSQMLYEEGGDTTGFGLRLNGNKLEAFALEGGIVKTRVLGGVNVNAWMMATATYDNGILKVYLNGTESGTIDTRFGTLGSHGDAGAIGSINGSARKLSGTHFFSGQIDDVRIFDGYALDVSEVRALRQTGRNQPQAVGWLGPLGVDRVWLRR